MIKRVVDASVVLAHLNGERGGDAAKAALSGGVISAVNEVEVITKLVKYGSTVAEAKVAVDALSLPRVAFTPAQGRRAADMAKLAYMGNRSLSLGDRCCVALGLVKKLPVYTAETKWAEVAPKEANIVLIR